VTRGIRGYIGCNLCQKRLKLSLEVDECEPLLAGSDVISRTLVMFSNVVTADGYGGRAVQVDSIKTRVESVPGFSA